MEVKLGGLGPDKDNDAYKTRVRANLKILNDLILKNVITARKNESTERVRRKG